MSRKRFYTTEEALQLIFEPGSDSEMEELEESDVEDPNMSTVALQPRIGDDSQPEPDFVIEMSQNEKSQNADGDGDGHVEEMGAEGSSNDDAPECANDDIDISKYIKHILRWRAKLPPTDHPVFLGDEFSLPPDDVDTWTPLTYFKLFWKEELNILLSEQTLYSVQDKSKSVNTTPGEIEQLIGLQMYMSIIDLPAFYMYWATETRYALITDVMSINRYKSLRGNLHVSDNSKCNEPENKDNKLYKIQPVLDHVCENCIALEPEEEQSIDEQIIPAKTSYSGIR